MSFEPGGRADKLGNRYENWWVAKQLLRVIAEEVQSLTLEPVGPDEIGTEFWLDLENGSREAYQCKARNGDKDKWTVNDLKHNGVLKNAKYQLDRNPDYKYFFVSAISSISLKDICYVARNSSGPDEFYTYQIKERGQSVRKTFYDYCNAMGLNPENPKELSVIYDYLIRTEIIHFADDRNNLEDVLRFANYLFNAEPQKVISLLFNYAIENNQLGKRITANALIQYLNGQGIYPRNLAHDTRIQPSIEALQESYLESIRPYLIHKNLITRSETNECLKALDEDGLIMLTGDSGTGKSTVLYELISELDNKSILYLPIRLDHQIPKGTAQQFGKDLGLPASPIHCIERFSRNKQVVVIIDQLDSIRWTSSHSTNALEVCKELIRQIKYFKREGRNISIVFACRSYDLKYDVELSKWFSESKGQFDLNWHKIKVSSLSEKQIKSVIGQQYNLLNDKQKQLLMNPQNLYMWTELEKNKSTFVSSVDLLLSFWETKMLVIERENIDSVAIDSTINILVDYMEQRGVISAPTRIINRESALAKRALHSHGILVTQGRRVRFSHQSYLDYLIAVNIIDSIDKGDSILEWIGDEYNQSLFRREQLRQALNMMIEEESPDFPSVVKDLLYSSTVRFHLKHLILEVIGHHRIINGDIELILLDLLDEPNMRLHVLDIIFYGRKTAIEMLLDNRIIQTWIDTNEYDKIKISINLLSSVKESEHPEISMILTKIINLDTKWEQLVIDALGWDIENDSEDIYRLRLQLIGKGVYSNFIDWNKTCNKSPIRVIKYIKKILRSIHQVREYDSQRNNLPRIERWYKSDLKYLSEMARSNYVEVWNNLFPEINRLYKSFTKNYFTMDGNEPYSITSGTVKLIIESGKEMAKRKPIDFIKRITRYKNSNSIYIQRIIIESFQEIDKEFADIAIQWFLNKPDIIFYNPIGWSRYKFARYFIYSLSSVCSAESFSRLEEFIINLLEEDIVYSAKRSFEYRRQGIFFPYWGEIQYLLLNQLDQKRISHHGQELIKVLKRSYNGKTPESLANMYKTRSGSVKSTLSQSLYRISDNSWIRIITSDKVPADSKSSWDDSFLETSIGQFSNSFRTVAASNPERFGKIGLKRLPQNIHAFYLTSLFSAISLLEPPNNDNEEKWKQAESTTVIGLINKYSDRMESKEVAIEFCRLIRSRKDIEWPIEIIKLLGQIACNHPDPQKNFMNLRPADWDKNMNSLSPKDLLSNSINCVRGVAADAIKSLLFERSELFKDLEKIIKTLVVDEHPSVRTGAVGMLLPIINIDRTKAVEWFIKAVKADYRVMCTNYGIQFVNYTVRSHREDIEVVLINMIKSNNETVVELGSEMLTGYNIIYGYYDKYISGLLQGSIAQKKGTIRAATKLINDKVYASKSRKFLLPHIEQYEPRLKNEISGLFRIDIHEIEHNKGIIVALIKSYYFSDIDLLILKLYELEGRITPYADIIMIMCEEVSGKIGSKMQSNNSGYFYMVHELLQLLLRVYEEALEENNKDILNRCLDIWDMFFIQRIGTAKELTNTIEGL